MFIVCFSLSYFNGLVFISLIGKTHNHEASADSLAQHVPEEWVVDVESAPQPCQSVCLRENGSFGTAILVHVEAGVVVQRTAVHY